MTMDELSNTESGNEIENEISIDIIKDITMFTQKDDETGVLLLVSLSDNETVIIADKTITVNKNQVIIIDKSDTVSARNPSYGIMCLLLKGRLVRRYIQSDRMGLILTFDTASATVAAISELDAVKKDSISDKRKAVIGFSILMDIITYRERIESLSHVVAKTIDIIMAEYGYLYGVDDLADKVGVNKSYLIRIFKENMNETPGRYLERIRMQQAKVFLSSGDFTIEMTAGLCGYACANYFGKVYKRFFGISPKAYMDANAPKKTHEDIPDDFYL